MSVTQDWARGPTDMGKSLMDRPLFMERQCVALRTHMTHVSMNINCGAPA